MKLTIKPLKYVSIFLIFLAFACQKEDYLQNDSSVDNTDQSGDLAKSANLYSVQEVEDIFSAKNNTVSWKSETDARLIYSVGTYTDALYAIGLNATSTADLSANMAKLNLESPNWQQLEKKVSNIIKNGDPENEITKEMKVVPYIVARILDLQTIKKLKAQSGVRYVAPLNDYFYYPASKDNGGGNPANLEPYHTFKNTVDWTGGIGCSCDVGSGYDAADAIPVTFPFVGIKPWNYPLHQINDDNWEVSAGENITVAVIDTGVSDDQENLGEDFNSPPSLASRTITKINMLDYYLGANNVEIRNSTLTAHDRCGHGTKMAGLIGAPRGIDGNAVGVAPNSNLVIYRAVHNPLINTGVEKRAVADAIEHAAQNPEVRIISMSLGMFPGAEDPMIDDAIDFAHGRDKLILCAAGTSFAGFAGFNNWFGTLFPASHPFTQAITGIREPYSYPNALTSSDPACLSCFFGDEVDFVSIIQRKEFESTSYTLAVTCDGDEPVYSTGSSSATATFAGIAALVWADQGTETSAATILSILNTSGSNPTPFEHPDFGNGWVDVSYALDNF